VSLRARVLVGMAVVAVVLAAGAVVTVRTTEDHLLEQLDEQLIAARDFGRDRGGPPVQGERSSSLYEAVLGPAGSIRFERHSNLTGEELADPDVEYEQAVGARGPFTVDAEDGSLRYRVVTFTRPGAPGVLVRALPMDAVDDAVDRLVTVILVAGAAAAAVLALVAWWVVHLGVRPIKQMTATATAIAAGDLSRRVPTVTARTEAGELGTALNLMLGRIEASFDEKVRSEERLRRFVADASHELRTPVTTIRGYAELYRAGGLGAGDELDEAMRRTEQEAVRMGHLVEDLLQLARLDEGRPLAAEPVDVGAVVVDAAADARAVAPERAVTADVDGPLVVVGDGDRLRQVVANVVGNALVHTPPGTPVELRAAASDGRVVVEVVDHGPGMPPDVAARAFERFYRADPSRSRHRGGSGLGLAIVDAVVGAHGGSVAIDSEPGRGTTVRLDLPAAPPPAHS
jgi:two-component system OmpR family sensor kinase